MTTRAARRGLHGYVVNLLGERIVKGLIRSGERLDLDSLLAEEEISRTVLRESLRVLSEKGLVEARTRLGTFVTDRDEWNLLDNDVMRWRAAGVPDLLLVHELGELRQVFEPPAARLAATRRTAAQLEAMTVAFDRMTQAAEESRWLEIVDLDAAFHRAILAATHNELLERFETLLEPAMHARNRLALSGNESILYLEQHRRVLEAITHGDGADAFSTMTELVETAHTDARDAASTTSPPAR